VEETRLGPLSREEAAKQVVGLVGGPPPPRFADDLYARTEGNPFFTEQLVAAAQAGSVGGELRAPLGLPERLAELLAARAARCGGGGAGGRGGAGGGGGAARGGALGGGRGRGGGGGARGG